MLEKKELNSDLGHRIAEFAQSNLQSIRIVAVKSKRLNEKFQLIGELFVGRSASDGPHLFLPNLAQQINDSTFLSVHICCTVDHFERLVTQQAELRAEEKRNELYRAKLVEQSETEVSSLGELRISSCSSVELHVHLRLSVRLVIDN